MLLETGFTSLQAMQEALHAFCRDALLADLANEPRVSCLLSGGRTPLPCYRMLAASPLPWDRIQAALVDERWVEARDPASNEGSIRDCFAGNEAFQASFLGMYGPGSPAAVQEACNRHYTALPRPASFCLLGLGADGHFASLFPHADGLREALGSKAPCQAIRARPSAVTGPHIQRMSLTLSGILDSRRLVLAFSGADKLEVFRHAQHCDDPLSLPLAALLREAREPIHVYYSP